MGEVEVSEKRREVFRRALYKSKSTTWRDLPWRKTRDPWAIVVSESMLQQTGVERVIAPYEAFVRAYPNAAALAEAPQATVLRLWRGLGYNRRALYLHRLARELVERHGGKVPNTLSELLKLSGVGAYSARAILVFAFEEAVGVVDTNVARVLARCIAGRPLGPRQVQELADQMVDPSDPWGYTQSLLDLGAAHCKARPKCDGCALFLQCRWQQEGDKEVDPAISSAGVSKPQSPFVGSDRQVRGRIINALREGPINVENVAEVAGWPEDLPRVERIVKALIAEGLVREVRNKLYLA